MLKAFEGVTPFIKRLSSRTYYIDNWVFKLHYRVTFIALLVCTVLVCSKQYIGEHIHCINDKGVPERVMNTYCFFTTTFTLIKDYDAKMLDLGNIPHPGVGSYGINSKDEIKRHAYYQWVPFVLFGQALMFYITHLIWKKIEGGRIKYLVEGLQLAMFTFDHNKVKVKDKEIPSIKERDEKIATLQKAFLSRTYVNGYWAIGFIFCEVLNLLNVLLQIYITNKFLNGEFMSLGSKVIKEGLESTVDPLDEIFPKVTKCTFHKYGPSGSIQWHDAMCVMALNVVNDKIYTFLWFWFLILLICSGGALIWRFITVLLHEKSRLFNRLVYTTSFPNQVNPWDVLTVSKYCSYTDWLFLKYLSKNLDSRIFKDVIVGLAEKLEETEQDLKESLLSNPGERAVENEYKVE